ncbi:MAG: NAD-dependent epimerase/dehydratase family protein [Chitinophagales bacterium]|nr:NAD-dependent epimerase/dehydratase family protein [Chitinophagales bacterium]
MEKLFITGSCGFFFSNFIRKSIYNKLNYEICSLDKISKHHIFNNIYQNKNNSFYIGDVLDDHLLDVIFTYEKPTTVIHSVSIKDEKDSNNMFYTNVMGTQKILDMCKKYNVTRFFYISSDEVYGEGENKSELSLTNPLNLYSESMVLAEQLVQFYSKCYGINYSIIRLSNHYGPRQSKDAFIPKIINNILNDRVSILPKCEDGSYLREWNHIADGTNAFIKLLETDKHNEIYNLSSNYQMYDVEIFQHICNFMGKGHNLIKFDTETKNSYIKSCSIDKIKKIEWCPEIKIKEGLDMTIRWYLDNKWWFKENENNCQK